MLQTLHIISTFETEKQGKGVSVPSIRNSKVVYKEKQKLSSLSLPLIPPPTYFPYLFAQKWVIWPLLASKEAGKAMKKAAKIDLDSGFQIFFTMTHSEKHFTSWPNKHN